MSQFILTYKPLTKIRLVTICFLLKSRVGCLELKNERNVIRTVLKFTEDTFCRYFVHVFTVK